MIGNFIYHNPTKLYFGKDSLNYLVPELKNYGKKVLLVYGKNAIKANGIYDQVINMLKLEKKMIKEVSGVMANPTLDKVLEGLKIARNFKPDLILAVGGGSVIDYAKALSVCIYAKGDIWNKFWVKQEQPTNKIVPVGCILTMVGTGSEMNGGSVITNTKLNKKIGVHFKSSEVFPRFAILNPIFTYSIPYDQMVSGIFDIFSHLCEQYFSNNDDNTSDYIAEGLMRAVISNSLIAIKDPQNYIARSNIMWAATWGLNTLLRKGKTQDWQPHKIGQAIGALTNAPHGFTLSAISLNYYKYMSKFAKNKFTRWAKVVWDAKDIDSGLKAMEKWMKQLKVVMHLKPLGVNKEIINKIVNNMQYVNAGYKALNKNEVKNILIKSL